MFKFVALAAFLASAPAVAAEPVDKGDKVVCKRITTTGWRTAKTTRVCRTEAEWEAESRQARKEMNDFNQGGRRGDLNP